MPAAGPAFAPPAPSPPAEAPPPAPPKPTIPPWHYQPVPEGPDKYPEKAESEAKLANGLQVLAGRVRGKMHKHDGTNCDDFFHFKVAGRWTFLAVSDGAGSKAFSRVGARAACQRACEALAESLANHELSDREWADGPLPRGTDDRFEDASVQFIQEALHAAILSSYDAVVAAVEERKDSQECADALKGRAVSLNDVGATLLLAVHTCVPGGDKFRSLVMTCQIGDGMIAAVDRAGHVLLLAEPESGDYSNETDFLTSERMRRPETLAAKTFQAVLSPRALLLMTDGVADDYQPYASGMLRLYGDLALNGILDLAPPPAGEPPLDAAFPDFCIPGHKVTPEGVVPTELASSEKLAEKLGVSLRDLVTSPARLAAGAAVAARWPDLTREQRLSEWLDGYHVRGSFDDRALAVLLPGVVADSPDSPGSTGSEQRDGESSP